jgi:hypothetical protein
MPVDRGLVRDWHRLIGLLLTDFFAGSPFVVEVERDLSVQQQLLDVVVVRRGRGPFAGRLPDGLEGLVAHNLDTFKSHHEAFDPWAVKELVGHYVAYRKLVSPSRSDLLPEDRFGLYAVCARLPHKLSGLVPWQRVQPGVYDCRWGTDTIRVVVAGELPRQAHNAPLHLFSASPELVGFGSSAYRRRSEETSLLLSQLFEGLQREGLAMVYTMEDFKRQFFKEHFERLTLAERQEILKSLSPEERRDILKSLSPEERRDILKSLSPEERRDILKSLSPEEQEELLQALSPEKRLAGLSAQQIRRYLDRLTARRPAAPRKSRRKK